MILAAMFRRMPKRAECIKPRGEHNSGGRDGLTGFPKARQTVGRESEG